MLVKMYIKLQMERRESSAAYPRKDRHLERMPSQSFSTANCTLTSHRGPLPSPYTLPR